jgi:hypothetical protein
MSRDYKIRAIQLYEASLSDISWPWWMSIEPEQFPAGKGKFLAGSGGAEYRVGCHL